MSIKIIARKTALTVTPTQVEGPFFIADAPVSHNAIPAGAKGDQIELRGQVLSENGEAIAGAIVHFWLADTSGVYDNQDDAGNAVVISPEQYRNRVRVKTSARGTYSLTCLRPGNYPLENEPVDVRPGHIHARIEAPGYKTLITQLYFQDDAYNVHDIPRDHFFVPELVVHLAPALPTAGRIQRGVFNFVLSRAK